MSALARFSSALSPAADILGRLGMSQVDPEQTWTKFLDTGLPELWGRVLATEEFGKIDRLSDHGYGQLQGDLGGGLR